MKKDKKKQSLEKKGQVEKGVVPFSLSPLSLSDRIRAQLSSQMIAALRDIAEAVPARSDARLPFERTGRREDGEIVTLPARAIRGASLAPRAPRMVPEQWTVLHVMDRLEEAMTVMAQLPTVTRPKEYGNAMPDPVHERFSLLDLIRMEEAGDLAPLYDDRNQVRLPPKSAQISRMEQALRWPIDYLADRPALARAVGLGALWAAAGVDQRRQCRRLGLKPKAFQHDRVAGVMVIVAELVARKVPVS